MRSSCVTCLFECAESLHIVLSVYTGKLRISEGEEQVG